MQTDFLNVFFKLQNEISQTQNPQSHISFINKIYKCMTS